MDSSLFPLEILCPEKEFFKGNVKEVVFYTPEGSIGIMAGHAPMFAAVSEGVLDVLADNEWRTAAVGQGFCELSYHHAQFFLDSAEWAEDIDVARAQEALERAEHRIRSAISRQEYLRTQASMSRALARLKAVKFGSDHTMTVVK